LHLPGRPGLDLLAGLKADPRLLAIPVVVLSGSDRKDDIQRGLNTRARWIGRFQPGTELWCQTVGKDLVCRHHPPRGCGPATMARTSAPGREPGLVA
jgi:CheY-like chemotaxis protein